jgi:ankyrin repeat protein
MLDGAATEPQLLELYPRPAPQNTCIAQAKQPEAAIENSLALSLTAHSGYEAVVKLLVGPDKVYINSKDDYVRKPPLLWAAENGYEAVIRPLLNTGKANANSNDDTYGQTALLRAAERGHEAAVMLLLDGKADVNTKDDQYSRTPLSWGCCRHRPQSQSQCWTLTYCPYLLE